MDEIIKQQILDIAAGNPGAINVLARMCCGLDNEAAKTLLDTLKKSSIKGSEVWIFYKDVCHEDLEKFTSSLTYYTPDGILRLVMEAMA